MNSFSLLKVALLTTCVWGVAAMADDTLYPEEGPFRPGEGFGTPATCETMPDWIDRAPEVNGRVSMVIEGPIVESHWDGALAYLIMCQPEQVQVMCVTYYPEDVTGEPVQFAGGYNRAGERQIILDPCLTYSVDGEPVEEN
tara:strand:+ start:847 stop:1269 length:423 start_codon:yes stop_codon:yes gene_type:complete